MNGYGSGDVLGAAIYLPATSAAGIVISQASHPVILIGFIVITVISLILGIAYIYRYLANRKNE